MVLGYYFNFKCEKKDKTNSFFEMNDLKKPALTFGLESLNKGGLPSTHPAGAYSSFRKIN